MCSASGEMRCGFVKPRARQHAVGVARARSCGGRGAAKLKPSHEIGRHCTVAGQAGAIFACHVINRRPCNAVKRMCREAYILEA